MKPSEQLKAAKALIATPDTWTQGMIARSVSGKRCPPKSENAVCWCSMGAADVVDMDEDAHHHLRIAAGEPAWMFNDRPTRTHPEVMEMWDRAIELAETDELK